MNGYHRRNPPTSSEMRNFRHTFQHLENDMLTPNNSCSKLDPFSVTRSVLFAT